MEIPTEPAALVTHFANATEARRFVAELRRAGFRGREVGVVAPRRELLTKQTLIGAALGALAGGILGIFVGAYATGTVPGVNPSIDINPFTGVILATLIAAIVGLVTGAGIALLVPPEDSGESYPDLVAIEQTLVVVETKDPARQEQAVEILAHYKRVA